MVWHPVTVLYYRMQQLYRDTPAGTV